MLLLLFRRRGAAVLQAEFRMALVRLLERSAPILAVTGGEARVYMGRAPGQAVAPYVCIEGLSEPQDTETEDDAVISVEINAYGKTRREVKSLARAIVNTVDPPASNPDSVRTGALEWTGGREEFAERTGGNLFNLPGGAYGVKANWVRTLSYEFSVEVDADAVQVAPDEPYVPDTEAVDLLEAVEAYLLASADLTAALGGAGKVFVDEVQAAGVPRPFVILEGNTDDPSGESDADGTERISAVVQSAKLSEAGTIRKLLCDLLDPPGRSRSGRRAEPFTWDGGREVTAYRLPSGPDILIGYGPDGRDIWSWAAPYDFQTERDG